MEEKLIPCLQRYTAASTSSLRFVYDNQNISDIRGESAGHLRAKTSKHYSYVGNQFSKIARNGMYPCNTELKHVTLLNHGRQVEVSCFPI